MIVKYLVLFGILILGSLGLIGQIFGLELPPLVLIFLLWLFVLLTLYQFIDSNNKDGGLSSVKNDIELEKTTIKSFSSKLHVVYSGKWLKSISQLTPLNTHYEGNYVTLSESESINQRPIIFNPTQPYSNDRHKKVVVFESIQTVQQGQYPMGQSINVLSLYDIISFKFPFFLPIKKDIEKFMESNVVDIHSAIITFFINGKTCSDIQQDDRRFMARIDDNGCISFNMKLRRGVLLEKLQDNTI